MSATVRGAILRLVARVLEPLVHLLIENGVGAGEMTRLLRGVYVRVAAERVSRGAERPNISRIAVLTGLTRAEVRALLAANIESPQQYTWDRHRAERVLYAWANDSTYLDAHGRPADLLLKGGKKSFAALVKAHSGTAVMSTILEELERAKAVQLLEDGRIRLTSHTLATAAYDEQALEVIAERAHDLLTTLVYNLDDPERPRFHGTVGSIMLDPREVPRIRRDLVAQSESLLGKASNLVHWPGVNLTPGEESKPATRLGVTVFIFEEPVVIPAREPLKKKTSAPSAPRRGRDA